jgi:hypothetical protein
MSTNKSINSVNLLPEFLRTDKNSKFLSSTLDQLIQPAKLERIDGYVGSTLTPNYFSTSDIYVAESLPLRRNYQLEPALVIKNQDNVVNDVIGLDDLVNAIKIQGGGVDDFDRLFRTEFYSYNPQIDWDKFVNYQNYYWLVTGPDVIDISNIDVDVDIIGQKSFIVGTIPLSNGMKVRFDDSVVPESYRNVDFFVEGVGTAIKLVRHDILLASEAMSSVYDDNFDVNSFDTFPFDGSKNFPLTPEYLTINRASRDLNPWSRYNRWVHHDVIKASAEFTNQQPVYPIDKRAKRPIIEFNADLKLFNFGTIGIPNVDLIDTVTLDAFGIIEGTPGYYVDGVLLQEGNRVIFTADTDNTVRNKVYQVHYITIDGKTRLTLQVADTPVIESVTSINFGNRYAGTSWWFDGNVWKYAQQHTTLNQAPLFDLFDNNGHSYSDVNYYSSSFAGNKIFGYELGTIYDPVLQFKIKYRNSAGTGSYLFKNYFTTDTIDISLSNQTINTISTQLTYCKIAKETGDVYVNVWENTEPHPIPLLTSEINTATTYYEAPLGLTNNPLNGPISTLTLSGLTDHVETMVNESTDFKGVFPGLGNLRDLPDISRLGNRLISNVNPMVFAHMFVGKKEHNLIDALVDAADQYNQFKLAFLKKIESIDIQTDPVAAVDLAIKEINADKDISSSYYLSDMMAYGTDKIVRTWTVTNTRNKIYAISSDFNLNSLSLRSVLVYLNGVQLIHGLEYQFEENDSAVKILINLAVGDEIVINDYTNNRGCFIPSTPSKLGLYPKYIPSIFNDTTYVQQDVNVIQGHDGSIMIAYDDYRDDIILEFEKRIFNNIKVSYRRELLDYNSIFSGVFRDELGISEYTAPEINKILQGEINNWAGIYAVDINKNLTFDEGDPFTWNYTGTYYENLKLDLKGSWRAIYKYFYDTDRPHTHPWEMLGFSIKPDWWDTYYSWTNPAKRTALISAITLGKVEKPPSTVTNSMYARAGFSAIVPVDVSGNLLDPSVVIVKANSITPRKIRSSWAVGDIGPAETAWRRSSYWPFVVQKLLALTKPSMYSALLYDPARITKNIADQWVYGDDKVFLNPKSVKIHADNDTITSGYSVYVSEFGRKRTSNYIQDLKNDIEYLDFNLFYKVGGFVSKEKIQVIIDAIDPTSTSPGAILPPEDYNLILNVSNPIQTSPISGVVVQKSNGKFIIRGYDNYNPYFNIYSAVRNVTTYAITVGGVSESFVTWKSSGSGGNTGLTDADVTTANSAVYGTYYEAGQLVSYGNQYYRTKISHRSTDTFNPTYFQIMPSLPIKGGVSVQAAIRFDKSNVIQIPYGTEFDKIQEVYDVLIGYGAWLEDQGFIFDQFDNDLQEVLNWNFSGKEFLYWTSQNWADNSVITLSPFAGQLKFKSSNSVVGNVFDKFYDRRLLQVNGKIIRQENISVNRQDGICTITTTNTGEGIYFATLNSIQKEHAMVFNNTTMFNDTIYDIESGYRQRRMKLVGFRSSGWDGDYFSPGFIYDTAQISDWKTYTDYRYSDIVRFNGNYYSANKNIPGSAKFDFTKWNILREKPKANLITNFDYKISQFEDFYSLDIDNFDVAQQEMAQHLTGYTPRVYLNNIFTNPVSQYKFYQGFIKEKGTKNAISKLAKASIHNLQGELNFTEEWAFRIGHYGSYETFKEIEISLPEGNFIENPQAINFVEHPPSNPNDLIFYSTVSNRVITPTDYQPSKTFVTTSSTDVFQLNTAGYVSFDDIDFTALNNTALLNLVNSNVKLVNGNYVWLGFKQNGDWGVFRYSRLPARIVNAAIETEGQLTFTTNVEHNLAVGDIVVVDRLNSLINASYTVLSIASPTQFIVQTNTAFTTFTIDNYGLLYSFISVRFESYNDLFNDNVLLKWPVGATVWVDDNGAGNWSVYQKTQNYKNTATIYSSSLQAAQKLGWSISKPHGSNVFMVGSPGFINANNSGTVFLYQERSTGPQFLLRYGLNRGDAIYNIPGDDAEFGNSIFYDPNEFIGHDGLTTGYGILFAGAPGTSHIKSNSVIGGVRYSTGTETASSYVQEGLIKISSIDSSIMEENVQRVLLSPYPSDYERFGASIYVQTISTSSKVLMVGAPQNAAVGPGSVYAYSLSTSTTNTGTIDISYIKSITTSSIFKKGNRWGHAISGSKNGEVIAISAPGYFTNTGLVCVFTGTDVNYSQTIVSPFGRYGKFGESIKVSDDGSYLFVSSPESRSADISYGKVAVYTLTNNLFVLDNILTNPVPQAGMKFGQAIDINSENNELIISAIGTNNDIFATFDTYLSLLVTQPVPSVPYVTDPTSIQLESPTTFDSDSTKFYDIIPESGAVYLFDKKTDKFRLSGGINPISPYTGTNFGYSISLDNSNIYVGSPSYANTELFSGFHQYNKLDLNKQNWNLLRQQDSLVDLDTVQKISLIDSFNEEVIEYLDTIDPLKGKIAGIANQDIRYKSMVDPAVYTTGTTSIVVDIDTNWADSHVGELWWDLSTAKYVWYEQGDLSYRKNNWGRLFPDASIDVYEWVGSPYLPSEWSQAADTTRGLTLGISGQPKYPDDTVLSIKEIYNSVTESFENRYYYWVKNKTIVPNVKNRRISAQQVVQLISDPAANGLAFAAIVDQDALSVANIGDQLVGNRINLNITTDIISNKIPRHTEWLLLQEGSPTSVPNTLLEKKFIDSLLGHDSLGNLVPDPTLSPRARYGIGIRPRQTLFKNRSEAIRNLVEFANEVLIKNQITGNYSFANLNKQEEIPNEYSREYDVIVEDNEGLLLINTAQLITGELSCTVNNGKIIDVTIDNPGAGYKISPTVELIGLPNSEAIIETEIDDLGTIISVNIVNPGFEFTEAPTLKVRPYTAIVLADSENNGKWSKFIYDTITSAWVRSHTQKYNTALYWKYQDWQSDTYNSFVDYQYTFDELYGLNLISTIEAGQYVKIKNAGLGNYIVLEKINDGELGTFNDQFNIVYSENGTIQILDSIWNFANNNFGFDQSRTFDQTLYDQTPDLELEYILTALKEDLFVNELKVNWNLLFFKSVKYALSEQKLLDWAFKTSFINVTNYAGGLDQRPVYKLQNSQYFEDYLKEVKPYHTNIRNFTTNYSLLEPTASYSTDFDLPSYYNQDTGRFETIEINSSINPSAFTATNTLTNVYPWKSWTDNYICEIGSIIVNNGGVGYTSAPTVTISSPNITTAESTTATAKAYIRSGEVFNIKIIDPGYGYTAAPTITLTGGGYSTTATAYAKLANGKIRSTTIGMKFDRVSRTSEIDTLSAFDSFVCSGFETEFVLSWEAEIDKFGIAVTLDGSLIISSDYSVVDYRESYGEVDEYSKKYTKIVFVNFTPKIGQVVSIRYTKKISSLHAVDRILNFYTATSGMPGLDLPQLMTGMEYPHTRVEGLPLDYTTTWDAEHLANGVQTWASPFGESSWNDDIGYYFSTIANSTSTIIGGTCTEITLSSTSGVSIGQYVNVLNTLTNRFTTATVTVIGLNTITNVVTFSTTTVTTISAGSKIEFWNLNSDATVLDSAIYGGTWNGLTLTNALGINPEDIVITGNSFTTADAGYAPEELVPGDVNESLGINVYTKSFEGAPLVISSYLNIPALVTTTRTLATTPTSIDSIIVVFGGNIFTYNSTTNFTKTTEFSIDWGTNQITVPPQPVSGKLGYTIVGMGGGRPNTEVGFIDTSAVTTVESVAQVQSLASDISVQSAYVTVNGVPINAITNLNDYGYVLTYAGGTNHRAAVNVYNLPPGTKTVRAWFFANYNKYYNEVREQIISAPSASKQTYTLLYPPGNIEPVAAQVLVEISNTVTNTRRMLRPPRVDYYQVSDIYSNSFTINNTGTFALDDSVRAYVNGIELKRGFEYTVVGGSTNINDVGHASVTINFDKLHRNDVVAILNKPKTFQDWDYDIVDGVLTVEAGVAIPQNELKIITYTDHDDMLIRTERFNGLSGRRYKISRPILNENYLWVMVNGVPLVGGVDYSMLEDRVTVQISPDVVITSADYVTIITISDTKLTSDILGYRIFNDMFNRTHFKRLSKKNTTYLTQALEFTDTEIHVADASVLVPPLTAYNIPGVVLIDGERIEFFTINGNVLSTLRRATLGTSPSFYSNVNTKVIDQSPDQTIPYKENIYRQTILTSTATNTYSISSSSYIINTGTYHQFNNNGIVLPAEIISSNNTVDAVNYIDVTYGGRRLNKAGTFLQDITLSYDSPRFVLVGTTSSADLLPATSTVGDGYIVTATNQVWVYEESSSTDASNGYVYRGLNYIEPEFTITTITNSSFSIALNIPKGVGEGVRLDVVTRSFARSTVWNDTISITETKPLMDSNTVQAKFLQAKPAELPDRYYYGGDPISRTYGKNV